MALINLVQADALQEPDNETESGVNNKLLPFAFTSDSMGVAMGVGGVSTGTIQPQASLFGLGLYSSNDSWIYYLAALNFQVPQWHQWLFSVYAFDGKFTEGRYYLSEDQASAEPLITAAQESFFKTQAKYIFPWGKGSGGAINSLTGPRNLSELKPIESWNPLISGTTSLEFEGAWQRRDLGEYNDLQSTDEVTSLSVELAYDNRNSTQIPSDGGRISFKANHDPGNSHRPQWTTWEFESGVFFDIGANDLFKQQVLGLSVWTADTPSWNKTQTLAGESYYQRPPDYAGVTLGGWDRLRGFDSGRYSDRSAISYSAEYRVLPSWQPLQELPLISSYEIPWWQWVFFLDAGNVHDRYDLRELHRDMKFSVGAGIRLKVEGIILRLDYAASEEGSHFRVLINHPF